MIIVNSLVALFIIQYNIILCIPPTGGTDSVVDVVFVVIVVVVVVSLNVIIVTAVARVG